MRQRLEFDTGKQSEDSPGCHCIDQALQSKAAQIEGLHARLHGLQEAPIDLCQHVRRSVLVNRTGLHALLAQVLAQILDLFTGHTIVSEDPRRSQKGLHVHLGCVAIMSTVTGSEFRKCTHSSVVKCH